MCNSSTDYSTVGTPTKPEERIYPFLVTGNCISESCYQHAEAFDNIKDAMCLIDQRINSAHKWEGVHLLNGDFKLYIIPSNSVGWDYVKFNVTQFKEIFLTNKEANELISQTYHKIQDNIWNVNTNKFLATLPNL